jgi:tight adherence protein C
VSAIVALAVFGAMAAAGGLTAIVLASPPPLSRRVRPYTTVTRSVLGLAPDVEPAASSVVAVLRAALLRRIDSRGDDALALRLEQARESRTPGEYRAALLRRLVANAAAFGALGVALRRLDLAVALAACGAFAGVTRGRAALDRAIEQRRERMQLELYTVNQLLALHVRSGAGPVQAVQNLVERARGEVAGELEGVLRAARAGVHPALAFRRAATRTPCPDAARTYRLFATATERGADLGTALLDVSEDLRDRRREALRKVMTRRRAAMLAPTIGILAPIMLLFVAAPLPSLVLGNH